MTEVRDLWKNLVSGERLRPSGSPERGDKGNQFLSDYYRVVFSSAFRRLQDKTQVTPLASTDFVRRRLTHSVEVSVVGERMGRVLANRLQERIGDGFRDDFGKIVATACLLHDIGNPPFGHEGELAIRAWADEKEIDSPDYRCFDGNAQGFRIAVRLQHLGKPYGLNLTAATLATMLKYPQIAHYDSQNSSPLRERGKWSVFSSEKHHYDRVREIVGIDDGERHPLSYVVEAADDIVNRLVDLEDALKLRLVSFSDICDALRTVNSRKAGELLGEMNERRKSTDMGTPREREVWAYQHFRVDAAATLAAACEQEFEDNIEELEDGAYSDDLVTNFEHHALYSALKELENEKIFGDAAIVRVEAGGKTAIDGLLSLFYDEIKKDSKLSKTVPNFPLLRQEEESEIDDVRRVVDYVSGMTDGYAISLYQELSGVSL